ncbi:MAG: biotin synthase BioB [Victivallales bacterium]|nr:biotin synthase BioB [Victivallales bacterium]
MSDSIPPPGVPSPLHPLVLNAYKVLAGGVLSRDEALALAHEIHGEDIVDLVSLANKVKNRFAGETPPCSIMNVKSGRCSQDCRFCSQSGRHHTGVREFPLLEPEAVLEEARKDYATGVRDFGYVASGYGYTDPAHPEFRKMLATFDLIHRELPEMRICVSVGILSRECAKALAEHHVSRYNMNLQTNPAHYRDLVATTHSIEEKIQTIRYLKEFGLKNCTGGIFGMGETWEDRIDMALAIRDLDVEGTPVNVLLPIQGTALESRPLMRPAEVAKCFAIYRLILPGKDLKFAAGRETVMKDFQGLLMLAGTNTFITGGYLTTRGRTVAEDMQLLDNLRDFR